MHRSGGETAVGDIVRMVEEAQSREAPVQQLVDKVSPLFPFYISTSICMLWIFSGLTSFFFLLLQVAGRFTYGVMAISAATFTFWNLFGGHILPSALHNGSPISLALQLSCSVLV